MHQHITTHSKVPICSLKRICQIELNELIELIELIEQIELIQQIKQILVLNLEKTSNGKLEFRIYLLIKSFKMSQRLWKSDHY